MDQIEQEEEESNLEGRTMDQIEQEEEESNLEGRRKELRKKKKRPVHGM